MFVASIARLSLTQAGDQFNGQVYSAALSPDGAKLAFVSHASNLVANDTNGVADLFLKDLVTGQITRISTDANGVEGNNAGVLTDRLSPPQFSPDGTKVLFVSSSNNLVADDASSVWDAFVKTVSGPGAGAIEMVSRYQDGSAVQTGDSVYFAAFSPDGAKVLLTTTSDLANSTAADPRQLAGLPLFLRDLATGQSRLVSANAAGVSGGSLTQWVGSVSPDGTLVAFHSTSATLVPGDTNGAADLFLKNTQTGAISRITTTEAGAQTQGLPGGSVNTAPAFSPDGTKVLFHSAAADLVPGDTNGVADLFIKTISGPGAGQIVRVSTSASGAQANGASTGSAGFSPDGTRIVFVSSASNLVAGDTNNAADVFVKDLVSGEVLLVGAPGGVLGNGNASDPRFSADGRSVIFFSTASNLVAGDTNGAADIFLVRLQESLPAADPTPAPPPTVGPTVNAYSANLLGRPGFGVNAPPATVTTPGGKVVPNPLLEQQKAIAALVAKVDAGQITLRQAQDLIVDMADGTTSAATMSYQFFTGKLPGAAGLAYLVSSAENPADLNDGFYAGMSLENRYINFAVNLGKIGEGRAAFQANYGALSLGDATAKAYLEIFGRAADAAKLAAILAPERSAYLLSLGGDALGQKAAMVGFLLAEAAKSDLGPYAARNENFLYDLLDGTAAFGADAHVYDFAGPITVGLVGVG